MNKNLIISVWMAIVLMFAPMAFAQQNPYLADSLISTLPATDDGPDKVKILAMIAGLASKSDPDRALIYSRQALALANKLQLPEASGIAHQSMAEVFESRKNFQPSINYYLISVKHYKTAENNKALAEVYNKLGQIYINNQFDYDQGLQYLQMALDHAEKANSKEETARALNSIGGVYYYRNNYEIAFKYFQEALKIRQQTGNSADIAASLNNIGEIYRLKENWNLALDYYNRAIEINQNHKHLKNLAINYLNKGLCFSATEKYDLSRDFFLKSIQINHQQKDTAALIKVLSELGNQYNKLQIYDSAIIVFQNIEQIAGAYQSLEGLRDASYGMSLAHEGKGNLMKAFSYFKNFTTLKDSLFLRTKAGQLDELYTRFSLDLKEKELELKDNEIALLQREQKIYHFRQLVLLLTLVLLIIVTALVYSKLRLKHKKSSLLLEQEAALGKAKQELMEIELRNKNNELTNFALHLIEKNKFLQELKSELKNLRNAPEQAREDRIKEMAINVQHNINLQRDLEEFQKNVDHMNAAFYQKLKKRFPKLTRNEAQLCAMLRLNLSTKEIAALNNISTRAVEMGRYRLRKKFNIPTEASLCEFLQDLI